MRTKQIAAITGIGAAIILLAIIFSQLPAEKLLEQAGAVALVVFFFLIVLEVVIAPIPGGVIAFLGSAQFGFLTSWGILYLANIVGASISFLVARALGQEFVKKQVKQDKRKTYNKLLHDHKHILWLLYAVPIFPIDTISILLSLSQLRFRRFLLILVTALPLYTGITAALGAYLGDYIPHLQTLSLLAFIATLLFLLYLLIAWKKQRNQHEQSYTAE